MAYTTIPTTLHLALLGLLLMSAVQDWRTRTASNAITIPVFLLGCAAATVRLFTGDILPFIMIGWLVGAHFLWGGLGEADVKMLAGMWGLWPLAGWLGLVLGLAFIEIWLKLDGRFLTRMRQAHLSGSPVLVALTVSTIFSFLFESVFIHHNV